MMFFDMLMIYFTYGLTSVVFLVIYACDISSICLISVVLEWSTYYCFFGDMFAKQSIKDHPHVRKRMMIFF